MRSQHSPFLLVTHPVVVDAAGQITSARIKNGSTKGKDIDDTTLSEVPSATSLDSLPEGAGQDKASILFGVIEAAGAGAAVARARGVVAVEQVGAGYFDVKFDGDVSGCPWMATYGITGTGVAAGMATTRGASALRTGDPSWIAVVVLDAAGNQVDGDGFSMAAMCP